MMFEGPQWPSWRRIAAVCAIALQVLIFLCNLAYLKVRHQQATM
jgi:hypothetical protein